jgi:hypothetical protein
VPKVVKTVEMMEEKMVGKRAASLAAKMVEM